MNKITMQLAPLNGAVAESGKPLQTITLTLMGYVVHGQKGEPGVGVPAGGTIGQVLAKSSAADYATQWVDQTGGGGGGGTWGSITGTLSNQTDLQAALDGKSETSHNHDGVYVKPADLASVATSGSYADLSGKPTLFSGAYADLSGKPILGSAAAAATTDFATATQGAKADAALPKAGGVMTGAITFAGAQPWPTFNQNTTGSAAKLTTARTLTIGSKGYTFDGSGNVTWTLADIGAAATVHSHSDATTGAAGFMSAADKIKLDGIATGAQVNAVTSVAGRTGAVVIASSDVSGLGSLATKSAVAVADITATGTPGSATYLRGDGKWETPAGGGSIAPGTIQYFASDPGAGWLKCDGSTYLRSSYSDLSDELPVDWRFSPAVPTYFPDSNPDSTLLGVADRKNQNRWFCDGYFGRRYAEYNDGVFSFETLPTLPSLTSTPATVADWYDDHICIKDGTTSPYVRVWKVSGGTYSTISTPFDTGPTGTVTDIRYSSDGAYLAIAHPDTSPYLSVYKRSGDSYTLLAYDGSGPGSGSFGTIAWEPGTKRLMACGFSHAYGRLYEVKGSPEKLTYINASNHPADGTSVPRDAVWAPGGPVIVAAGNSNTLSMFIYDLVGGVPTYRAANIKPGKQAAYRCNNTMVYDAASRVLFVGSNDAPNSVFAYYVSTNGDVDYLYSVSIGGVETSSLAFMGGNKVLVVGGISPSYGVCAMVPDSTIFKVPNITNGWIKT